MKLLVDYSISFLLCRRITEFIHDADAVHASSLSPDKVDEAEICRRAIADGRFVVTQDANFVRRCMANEHAPRIVYVDIVNPAMHAVERIMRQNLDRLVEFSTDLSARVLVVSYGTGDNRPY